MGRPVSGEVQFDFSWNRKPDNWGFDGNLVLSGLDNLDSLANAEALAQIPEARAAFPFLASLEAVDFSGNLPIEALSPTDWNLTILFRSGDSHTIDFRVDPAKTPWDLSVKLSPFDVDLAWLSPLVPPTWGLPQVEGTGRVEKAEFSGPLGDWKAWTASVRAEIEAPSIEVATFGRTLTGTTANLEFTATSDLWKGTVDLAVEEAAPLAGGRPIRGLRSEKLSFEYSMKDGSAEIFGPWSARDVWGSAYRGSLQFNSKTGYWVEAETENLNWSELPHQLDGAWRAKLRVESRTSGGAAPKFQATLSGDRFRLGGLVLSGRPVVLNLQGSTTRLGGTTTFEKAGLTWGEALRLDTTNAVWDGAELSTGEAALSGDLAALLSLAPDVRVSPWVERYLNPKGWTVRGGFRVRTQPTLEVEIEQGRIDSGRGVEGPIGFRYSQSDRTWSLQAPTVTVNLAELAKEMDLKPLEIKGAAAVRADFSGRIPSPGQTSVGWLSRAFFAAEVRDCDGRVSRHHPNGRFDQHLFEWQGAEGRIDFDWNSNSKRCETNLALADLIWHTRPGDYDRPVPPVLRSGKTRIQFQVDEAEEGRFEIRRGNMTLGPIDPLGVSVAGSVRRSGGAWTPDLRIRLQGNRSRKTAVFRGVQMGGSGIFQGTIRENNRGNWILNGKANLDGLEFHHVAAPVVLTDVKGTFEVIDVALDEYMFESRWNARPHEGVSEITDPDILEKAFRISRGTSPNITIPRMEIGTNVFRNVAMRVVRKGEFLYMNTASGVFEQGGFPVRMTGYFFFHPRDGVAYRVAGYTERAPLGAAIPLVGSVGFDQQAVEVRFMIAQDLFQEEVQTRYINLGIPIDGLKDIPGLGRALFGWTPDSLRSREIVARKVGDGEWTILNPITLNDAIGIPDFILRDLPGRAIGQTRDMGSSFLEGFGEGVRDFFDGEPR